MAQKCLFRRALLLVICIVFLFGTFTAVDIWRGQPRQNAGEPAEELAELGQNLSWQESEVYQSQAGAGPDTADSLKRHIRLNQQRMAVYAGPIGGNGELLRQLDLPLQAIPARWLALLTNGGIEFADEETLLMALDNLDELADEWDEAMATPVR